jgi:hypothetical protein
VASKEGPKKLGAIFRSTGLTAGAAAQKSPQFTSTALQMAILYESPGYIIKLEV